MKMRRIFYTKGPPECNVLKATAMLLETLLGLPRVSILPNMKPLPLICSRHAATGKDTHMQCSWLILMHVIMCRYDRKEKTDIFDIIFRVIV